MKFIKSFFKYVVILLLLLTIGLFFYYQHLKPTYNGTVTIDNVKEEVRVYFDKVGVPHIYANNQEDAYIALGYVHAQDRLWQMELIRRIGAGRLAEILGEDLVDVDKFFLTMGVDSAADKTIAKLDKTSNSYILTQAYLKGINQFIDKGPTPIEYNLIGVNKEHFNIKDIYNVFGYMSFSFAMAQKTDPLLSKLKDKLDVAYLNELNIDINPKSTIIPISNPETGLESNFVSQIDKLLEKLPISPFIGSNAWIVGPNKTASGKVIFANDPHIAYSQPGVWYQSHIVCPDFEIYGFNLALTPFPLLGHNRQFAYGLTMFENDDIDFYAEKNVISNPNKYKVGEEEKGFISVEKTIKVKDKADVVFEVKRSIHGPIMNDFIGFKDSEQSIAMDWIYTKFENKMLTATYEITHSNSLEEFTNGVAKIVAPGLNVMYADTADNIAWFAAGKLYKHEKGISTKYILDGSNKIDDKLTFIDFKDNPKSINPKWNYVYSANNQPDYILDSLLYPGYYLSEDRAKRITNVLDNLHDVKVANMKSLITDNTSSKASNLVKIILSNIDNANLTEKETYSIKILKRWKGDFELDGVAPTVYTKFKYQYLKHVFMDEMGTENFNDFMGTHLVKRQFNKQLETDFSVWNDDINTKDFVETKKQIITKAFKVSVKQLEKQLGESISDWKWRKVHTLEHQHPIGKKVAALREFFNVGPFEMNGTNEVLNNQMFEMNKNGIYHIDAGPSTRRIIDFNDVENSIAIIPTGQSGNPFSKHYRDQAQKFVNGQFFTMLINKDTIQKSKDRLIIK